MRLECEKIEEYEATPELIRELVRDGAKRGEYMIMMRDDDEESYVQIACDFDEVGGTDDGCFDLEYREGSESPLLHCRRRVSASEIEGIFLDELNGLSAWRHRYEWEKVPGYGSSGGKTNRTGLVKKLFVALFAAFAFAYVIHAAYLWFQFGHPTGFCTSASSTGASTKSMATSILLNMLRSNGPPLEGIGGMLDENLCLRSSIFECSPVVFPLADRFFASGRVMSQWEDSLLFVCHEGCM